MESNMKDQRCSYSYGFRVILCLTIVVTIALDSSVLQGIFEGQPITKAFSEDQQSLKKKNHLLVLHVGPGKTGTTTIQDALKISTEILQRDHYRYIGNGYSDVLKKKEWTLCDENIKKQCTTSLLSELREILETEDHNLVGSSEFLQFLNDDGRQLLVNVTGNKWDVKVIVSYRRLHEYLPSIYNQRYKVSIIEGKMKIGHHNWPGIDGNYRIPSFLEFLPTVIENEHATVQSYEAWSKNFPVSIFNIHQEGDLLTKFVCQGISDAHELCQISTNHSSLASNTTNESTSYLDWDMLAVFAHEQGLVHELDNRHTLAKNIGGYLKRSKLNLPKICPEGDTLAQIYSASLKSEFWAAAFGAPKPVTDFQTSWEETLEIMKLCSVNTTAALEQEVWKKFFRQRFSAKEHQKNLK